MHNSYKEIFGQGATLSRTYEYMTSKREEIVKFINEYKPGEIVFIACGSSYWLSLSAALTIQRETGIRCSAVKSGDIVLDPACYARAYSRPLVIAPSRSGRTTETLIAVEKMKEWYKCPVITLTEYEECPILNLSDLKLEIPWVNEISICQTRSFSNLYMSCIMIAAFLSDNNKILTDIKHYIDSFDKLSAKAEDIVKKIIREDFPDYKKLVVLGSGCQYGVACEGAYIVIEMAEFLSSYFGVLEYRHGPIVTADKDTLVALFSNGDENRHECKMLVEIRQNGSKVLALSANKQYNEADWNLSMGMDVGHETAALYGIMVMQGMAYYKALERGVNPDSPGELVPFIEL
ncbi:MAG TPA: SIS domain-containing protein [Clostridiaceae bacterium]|nr:SIS domain-containing protein [Clostridiaceae bacterium]